VTIKRSQVFVSAKLPLPLLDRLMAQVNVDVWEGDAPASPSQLAARCHGVEGLLSTSADRIDEALLASCTQLRVVSNLAVGFDNVDVDALDRRRIPLGNTPGVLTAATADLTMALVLATSRRVVEARDAVLEGHWKGWESGFMLGLELSGATLGIVGLGRIGRAVARRAQAFDMHVLGYSRSASANRGSKGSFDASADASNDASNDASADGIEMVDLDELLTRSDVVSLHVSLSASTAGLIGARELGLMKPSAVLVNTARGAVVDQRALTAALVDGTIAAAGLDVVEIEPIPRDDPLLGLSNCIVLPHIGSATHVARARMAEMAIENLLAGLAGEPMPACVNPEAR